MSRRRRAAAARRRRSATAARELDALRGALERAVGGGTATRGPRRRPVAPVPRWNASPEEVQRSVAHLVLTLVEFLRVLFERQTLRRLEAGTLTPAQVEALGRALMRLERTVRALARRFGLRPEELNLDLGPLGWLR